MSESMPLPKIKTGGEDNIEALLKETVGKKVVPAVFYAATNAKETIYANQDGDLIFGDESSGKVNRDTAMELVSMTKLVTAVAAMQLVEQGLVSLDGTEDIEKHLPEIGGLEILKGYEEDGTPILVKPKNKITLRMLLAHTSGFVYPVTTIPSLHSGWTKLNPLPGIFNAEASLASITVPLAFEPGTSRAYGVGITWAGKLVERVSSLRLDEYFRQHIFDHVEGGMPDVSFFPTPEIKKRKMWMCSRDGEGKIKATGRFGLGRAEEAEKISTELLLGGEGLFGTLKDYLAFLRAVLQCDPRYRSNIPHPLLSAGSYAELFRGSIPPLSAKHDGRSNLVQQVGAAGYLDPPPTPETLDHSVGFCLTLVDCVEGRKKGSGFWSGVAKTQYWIDPTTGIAAICGTQLISTTPDPWFEEYKRFERCLYANLEEGQ